MHLLDHAALERVGELAGCVLRPSGHITLRMIAAWSHRPGLHGVRTDPYSYGAALLVGIAHSDPWDDSAHAAYAVLVAALAANGLRLDAADEGDVLAQAAAVERLDLVTDWLRTHTKPLA